MGFLRAILAFLTGLALCSCSQLEKNFSNQSKEQTTVKFGLPKSQGPNSKAVLAGGLLIYVVGVGNPLRQALYASNEVIANSGSVSATLPNGSYRFYSLGYTGANLTGTAQCGVAAGGNSILLAGGSQTIDINMDSTSCSQAAFSPTSDYTDATYGLRDLKLVSCSTRTNLGSKTNGSTCAGTQSSWSTLPTELFDERGNIHSGRSFRVVLNAYGPSQGTADAPTSTGISSACIPGMGSPGIGMAPIFTGTIGMAMANLGSGKIVVGTDDVGTNGFIYSSDSGTSFPGTANVTTTFPTSIKDISGSTSLAVAAGSDSGLSGGLFISLNGGSSWSPITTLTTDDFSRVAVSGNKIIAFGFSARSLSSDGGSTWSNLGSNASLSALIANPEIPVVDANTGDFYIIGDDSGFTNKVIAKSSDGGANWVSITSIPGSFAAKAFRVYGSTFYLGTDTDGMYYYNGSTWTHYCSSSGTCTANNQVLYNEYVSDVLVGDGVLYVQNDQALFSAQPIGASWGNSTTANWATMIASGSGFVYEKLLYSNHTLFIALGAGCSGVVCFKKSDVGTGAVIATNARIPVGGPASDFLATTIEVYGTAGCTNLIRSVYFPTGLKNAHVSKAAIYPSATPGVSPVLFLAD